MEKKLQKPVTEFMTKKVIAVTPGEPIRSVFQLMDEHNIAGIPVVDGDNRVVGMVTESDLIKHFTTLKTPRGVHVLGSLVYLDDIQDFNETLKDHCAETVEALMVKEVVTAPQGASFLEALDLMASSGVNRLPIVDDDGKLVGLLTRTDVIHQLASLKTM